MEDEDELVNSEDELAMDGSGGGKLSSKSLPFPSHSENKKVDHIHLDLKKSPDCLPQCDKHKLKRAQI